MSITRWWRAQGTGPGRVPGALVGAVALSLLAALVLLTVAAPVATGAGSSVGSAPPNIVVFLVDDMGWQDTSVPFLVTNGVAVVTPLNRKFHTPNMERLASQGMKFTSAYACCVCTPTRVSLMTGMNAARHRVTNWTLRKDTPTDGAHPNLVPPAWNVNGLSPDPSTPRAVQAKTLAACLQGAGYRTIHVGKAHWGAVGTPGADPKNLGFDVNIAGHAAGAPGNYLGEKNYAHANGEKVWDVPGLESYHGSKTFLTEALTIEALKAVDDALAARKPFFLYLAHYAVHVPFAQDARYFQKYRDAGLDLTEAMYAGLIEGMDKSLGDVMDRLKERGVSTNTVVIFMSDNGGLSAQGRGGAPHTHNAPLSSGKGSAREGGIREPMIVSWPGVVKPGAVCDKPLIVEDFYPTLLQIAGVPCPVEMANVVDGVSFLPSLRGEGNDGVGSGGGDARAFYWHYPNVWGPSGLGIGPFSAIRCGDWKLIYYHDGPRFELFDLAHDLGEEHDLFTTRGDKAGELAGRLRKWLESVEAQMPADKATRKPVPMPTL